MRINFVDHNQIQHVVNGFNELFQFMIKTGNIDADHIKDFLEKYFQQAGYREKKKSSVENILIIHDSGVGDFIIMSAAIREIRRIYPEAHITFVVSQNVVNLVECCPYIDEVVLDHHHCDFRNFLSIYQWNAELSKKLLLRRYDMAFPLSGMPSELLLAYMSGTQKIFSFKPGSAQHFLEPFGSKLYEPFLTEIPVVSPHFNENSRFSRNMILVDSIVRYPIANREGEVWLSANDRGFARDLLSAYISNDYKIYVICMGGTAPRKQWSPKNYARLTQMIAEQESKVKFIVMGGGQLDNWSADIFKQSVDEKFFNEYIIDMTNKCTYRQSGAILEFAEMYIGNDTGTMHLAVVVKTPVLTPNCFPVDLHKSIGGGVPKGYYPYHVPSVTVQPKHALPECQDSKDGWGCCIAERPHCITQITVETMFDGYNKLKERIADNNIEPLFIS